MTVTITAIPKRGANVNNNNSYEFRMIIIGKMSYSFQTVPTLKLILQGLLMLKRIVNR